MDVEIKGAERFENFEVHVHFQEGSSRAFNIRKELTIDDDLDCELTNCAATEHFWSEVAIEARYNLESFEAIQFDKYQAWVQKYSRYYLKGLGEKGATLTKAHIEQTAMLVFSDDGIKQDKDKYGPIAFQGYKEECLKVGVKHIPYEEFIEDMYHYDESYEYATRVHMSLKRKAAQLESIAKAFNTKSWSIKVKAADKRALLGSHV